jgi:hypothetical protein
MNLILPIGAVASAANIYGETRPHWYSNYRDAPESPKSDIVKALALRIFQYQIRNDGPYAKRIQGMIDHAGTLDNFIATHLKVVSLPDKKLIHSKGTDTCHYINIASGKEDQIGEALPWLSAREIFHILEQDDFYSDVYVSIAAFAPSLFASFKLRWSPLPSLVVFVASALSTTLATEYLSKRRADAFANTYCSSAEKNQAIASLETYKNTLPLDCWNKPEIDDLKARIDSIHASFIPLDNQ